ncbi:sarcosine oxidase subunit gamma [Dongia sedimenti]|uniref:Sarcosine oxidase subunit gamma family protein n=1 Tax=Dongia sedimenti TaxID=3064282 RepID=A0ABU0YQK2_9PROT|nr:sarcosine oxidase subunit gamma family protein [Rhodospirillaceae bacterium R-7]
MLERRSALAVAHPFAWAALTLGEVRGFTLTQVAGFGNFAADVAATAGALPETSNQAVESNGRTIFRTGPHAFWFVGPENDDLAARLAGKAIVTPLSSSRTRISIEGRAAREVLRKGIPIDLHESVFTPGMFAQTGLHHTPVLLHCTAEQRFELYAMRTFALNVWEWLEDAALEFK